ncbi:hypothetical protein [Paenibacillus odorifer]|uniref:hypothetical protein n=1 Tax=Paenibacillus odorifer TaxID=189426 RepID=UPI00096FC146|nr:hypothetical protein [Paenibacillus odorifer]OMD67608.1 hypothetical protein BSK50_30015 [Paenibacillus odorifer]
MKSFEELIKMSTDELRLELEEYNKHIKQDHDVAVLMGSLGVSTKHMDMYFDSVKIIKSMKE